jgi:S1-C subfamily serine protease
MYRFDDAKHKAVATTTDKNGKVRETIRYELDDAGRFSSGEIFAPDGRLRFRSRYSYDQTGRLEEETQSAKNGALLHRIVYSYDPSGNQTGYSVFDAAGNLVKKAPVSLQNPSVIQHPPPFTQKPPLVTEKPPSLTEPPLIRKRDRSEPDIVGTGFFVSTGGYFLTNEHVVHDAERVVLHTENGDVAAVIVKTDRANDIAVLKAQGSFECLPIGDANLVALGDPAFTIGFPNIQIQGLAPKLTTGEISALSGIGDDPRFFQIGVPIQPGNSGGPLVNEKGNVIGITSSQLSAIEMLKRKGSLPQNENYAVKISYAQALLGSIASLAGALPSPTTDAVNRGTAIDHTRHATAVVLVWTQPEQ